MSLLTQVINSSKIRAIDALHVLLGSLYIAFLAQVEIPLSPVPVTMHTFAIFSLALFQGAKKSTCSTLLYLVEATLGLPVFPSLYANSLWMLMPSAGYCLAFPVATYLIGKMSEQNSTKMMVVGLIAGQFVIYLFGVTALSFFLGWNGALVSGLYPFILFDSIKLAAAASTKMAFRQFYANK